uniref:Uncharacterized protein n=1 Tax=viral metagenome TaxID=1070528 RepID=A0A6C0BM05_9ZZZZ
MSCIQGLQGSRGPTGQQGPAGQSFIVTFPSISDGVSFISNSGNDVTGQSGHPELPFINPPSSEVVQLTSDLPGPQDDKNYFSTARQSLAAPTSIFGNNTYRGLFITGSEISFTGNVVIESCILDLTSSSSSIISQTGSLLIANSVIIVSSDDIDATLFNTSGTLRVINTTIKMTGVLSLRLIGGFAIDGVFTNCVFRMTNGTLLIINGADGNTLTSDLIDSNNLVLMDTENPMSEGSLSAPGVSVTTNRLITRPQQVFQQANMATIVYNNVTIDNKTQSYRGEVQNTSGTLMRPRMQLKMVVNPSVQGYTIGRYDYAIVVSVPVTIPPSEQIHGRILEVSSRDPNVIVEADNIISVGTAPSPVVVIPPGYTYILQYNIVNNTWYVISILH